MSDAHDRTLSPASPPLATASPLASRRVLVIGPDGPLARALERVARARGAVAALAPGDTGALTLGTEADADRLFDEGTARLPEPDAVILVVPAEPLGKVDALTLDAWVARTTDPLRQVFWFARRVVEGFLADAVDGRLVLVTDPAPGSDEINEVIEGGLRSFALSFVREYGRRGLACNVVVTAGAPTSGTSDRLDALTEQALFLASPAASFVNGESVVVGSWWPHEADA